MNYTFKFKSVALSALLLSAIAATPIIASANAGTTAGDTRSNQVIELSQKGIVAVKATTLSNPLELAKKYAPNTVSDWETTLEQYHKAVGLSIGVDGATIKASDKGVPGAQAVLSVSSEPLDLKNVKMSDAIKMVNSDGTAVEIVRTVGSNDQQGTSSGSLIATSKPLDIKELEKSGEFKFVTLTGEDGEPLQAVEAIAAQSIDGEAIGTVDFKKASAKDQAFFSAQLDLAQSVESQDTSKIKASLAELLKQYRVQITVLEAAE
ncbi:hypothetical protein EBB07_11830 [Paenibacillaceae bacterium]|nr:hypothetical protein EBB07_11830 [Paenibacillaceae bacterium]